MQILHEDIASEGTLSSFNLDTSTVISDLFDPRLSRNAKFIYYSGVTITLTFTSAQTLDTIAIAGTEFTDASEMSLNGATASYDFKDGSGYIQTDEPLTDTVFILNILDSGTTNGTLVDIGRLMAGTTYQTPGINDNVTFDRIVQSDTQFSASRQVYGSPVVDYGQVFVQLPLVEQEEKPVVDSFIKTVGDYTPFFVRFDEPCFSEGPFYVILGGSGNYGFQFNDAHFWTIGFTFEEVF